MTSADKVSPALPAAMTGRASPAKAALGDKPVFAYINSLPEPQRSIAERVDALAAKTLSGLQRSVKWGMAWYGVGDGWCFSCGGFEGHVKVTLRSARPDSIERFPYLARPQSAHLRPPHGTRAFTPGSRMPTGDRAALVMASSSA